jgi:lipid-binding SYLF domain-containing protein
MLVTIRNGTLAIVATGLLVAPALGSGQGKSEGSKKESASEETKLSRPAEWSIRGAEVLRAAAKAEDGSIPDGVLGLARAVVVIPHVGKGAGDRWGNGLVAQRRDDGGWSSPAFVSIGGAVDGFRADAEGTDLVLVLTDDRGVKALLEGRLALGADVPAVRSYAQRQGKFAGVSLDGAVLTFDADANGGVYGQKAKPAEILERPGAADDRTVGPFLRSLVAHLPGGQA